MKIIASLIVASLLSGCAGMVATSENLEGADATLTPRGATYQDLISLPPQLGKFLCLFMTFAIKQANTALRLQVLFQPLSPKVRQQC